MLDWAKCQAWLCQTKMRCVWPGSCGTLEASPQIQHTCDTTDEDRPLLCDCEGRTLGTKPAAGAALKEQTDR